ncbi:programmed cell death 1 ligand 1-like [Pelobates fuscus]|uniref:programmed cell death 1 ligand 1-like n=1 Tax=Pelobates fuscus TaxID=191477 RepID=UPI002FE4D2A8
MAIHRLLVFTILFWSHCSVRALFTVHVVKSNYIAEYGNEVRMECHFQVEDVNKMNEITVYWEHIGVDRKKSEVAKFLNGSEDFSGQHEDFKGRVKMLVDELPKGHTVIVISNILPRDSGQYRCIVATQGADYKTMDLDVKAPYNKIYTEVTNILTASGQRMKEISCRSVGFPNAEVMWLNERENLSAVVNTSFSRTADLLFNVTSAIRISSVVNKTFTCRFLNVAFQDTTSLTFTIPDDSISTDTRSYSAIIIFAICILMLLIILFFITYCKKTYWNKKAAEPLQANTEKAVSDDSHNGWKRYVLCCNRQKTVHNEDTSFI